MEEAEKTDSTMLKKFHKSDENSKNKWATLTVQSFGDVDGWRWGPLCDQVIRTVL